MYRRCILLLISAIVAFYSVSCLATEADVSEHITKVDIGNGTTAVTVITAEMQTSYIYKKAFTWGGDIDSPPKSIIANIIVSENKQNVFVPLSAYADLGDPRHIELKSSDGGYQLRIVGGDAAGSYTAILTFNSHGITHRKVISGEFPEDAW